METVHYSGKHQFLSSVTDLISSHFKIRFPAVSPLYTRACPWYITFAWMWRFYYTRYVTSVHKWSFFGLDKVTWVCMWSCPPVNTELHTCLYLHQSWEECKLVWSHFLGVFKIFWFLVIHLYRGVFIQR